jgi:outer membrane beta-barrel protein
MSARNSDGKQKMKRFISLIAVALGFTGVTATTRQAAAQEIQITGPLAGAPAIRKERLYRKGRFELAPTVSFTLLDEYRRTIFFGARLQYNITEWLGIGVWGAYGAVSSPTGLTSEIDSSTVRDRFTQSQVSLGSFAAQTATQNWMAVPQVQFTPFRGKLAIFQKIFVDTDAYFHLGLAVVGIQERAQCGAENQLACTDPGSFALAGQTKFAPSFGLGLSFYINDFLSLGAEYRAYPFAYNPAGFDTRGSGNNGNFPDGKIDSNDDTFQFNQMVTISLGFSLPSHPKISE